MWSVLFQNDMLLFTIPALLGTVVFLLKIGLLALAGFDADVDAGADMDATDVHAGDSTHAFQVLSIHSIAALLMGFGWGGIVASRTFRLELLPSVGIGLAFGAALVWLLGMLLKLIYDLQGSGNVNIDNAVGREGSVYVAIPETGNGRGQVRVVLSERARIYNAMTEGEGIARGSRVRVTKINDDRTLMVVKV